MGWIGSAVWLLAPKGLPGFSFLSIALGAKYLSYVKFIATEAPTFFVYIISVLASVCCVHRNNKESSPRDFGDNFCFASVADF